MLLLTTHRLRKRTACLLVGLFWGCSSPSVKRYVCVAKELDLYVGNIIWADTLVRARVVLDDTLVVDAPILRMRTSSEKLTKSLAVCPGPHRLQVRFGQFRKDTVLAIAGDQSLFVTYNYATYEGADNGIAIALLNHDYNWYHRID
ncbi:hypothetical protein KB206_18625 [Microvirga sp. STS02]|uniref:hypothetical protein n=1 Tax=Hymenobacter negativus TaxID=2795026 RepID=UPI0018DC5FFB|nr:MULTISPECIES: hypothetical protein [Bacteria]MBH8570913.1 hypothetical protein [Hymenobacter negativus]MBR7210651.1 hypothetical protein [Microvirga sp. STS02]